MTVEHVSFLFVATYNHRQKSNAPKFFIYTQIKKKLS